MPTNPRRRRVPPRGNPEPEAQASPTYGQQVAQIPWLTLVLTTGVTTLAGYAFIEMAKAGHRAIKRRREAEHEAILAEKNPPKPQLPPPGVKPNGTFSLPMPGDAGQGRMTVPPHVGFAAPGPGGFQEMPMSAESRNPLTDVSTPGGQLRHEFKTLQHNVDGRLQRIEALLANHYGATA
jgi:hypothetical protein